LLTVDLVRARRRGGELRLTQLKGKAIGRARRIAEAYLELAREHVGASRGALEEACAAVAVNPRERKLALGLKKLVEDQCVFETDDSIDARALRKTVFQRAAAVRRSLGPRDTFDRGALLSDVAEELGWKMEPEELCDWLYSDLREAQLLREAPVLTPSMLVDRYEVAQAQAVLLRATRVVAEIKCKNPATYRHIFGKLKFRRLLYKIRPARDGAYRVEIDGPYSLFSSSTKYGLQLALILPVLQLCDSWTIEAAILWGKERTPLTFSLTSGRRTVGEKADAAADSELPDEVSSLLAQLAKRKKVDWRAEPATEILDLPGLGLCVPDVRFIHEPTGATVFMEVMGFWSRDAVWHRVELVQAGLPHRILFAVPSRLRVSEEVLDDGLPGALYVYKTKMKLKLVLERLDALLPNDDEPDEGIS